MDDCIRLFGAMKLYANDAGVGYIVKSYGDGLMMIKPKESQGRCLFFTVIENSERQTLVAILAYKKEGQKLPERVRKLAQERIKRYMENQK